MSARPVPPAAVWPRVLLTAALVLGTVGANCNQNQRPAIGSQLFTSPQTNPIALSADGTLLYVANTTNGTLSVFDASPPHLLVTRIAVGMDPVGVAVRPKLVPGDPGEDELILVTNHISDTISVVSRDRLEVVQTLQELDGDGVTLTDEPVGVAFASPTQAFVTLDNPNQVLGVEFDAQGVASLSEDRATLTAQAPRAIAAANGRVYVAAFESGNQSEFTSCGAGGGPPYDPNGHGGDGTGCQFPLNILNLIAFATNPNIGGEVVHNPLIPDRDLFVYDAADFFDADATPEAVSSIDEVTGLGTLHYGIATIGDTVYLTNTDARNKKDGLDALGGRMFDNRLTRVPCPGGSCQAPTVVDLDASAGVPVATPYGIRAADDGAVLVASVAGSDGVPGIPNDPGTDIPGLVTLDANGNVLGAVQTGAIPQGLALLSDGAGAAQTAYVLNTVESTISVVDVSSPATPAVVTSFSAGPDPTPADVRSGRIQFSSARASSTGTFSCESCHPNANIDQIDWTINTAVGVDECEDQGASGTVCAEPRSTMPIRGLRDTLPLHWVGNLADPFGGGPEDSAIPDCDLQVDGELGCIEDLVNASLSGVMCDPTVCPVGPSGLPGALGTGQRQDMAAFLAAVSFPPSPTRRPTDVLSTTAAVGVDDFFTDEGGIGGGGTAATCANADGGCHALPLTVATNSPVVGGFDAPSIRGLWDRHITFSNGFTSNQDNLAENGYDVTNLGPSEFESLAVTFPGLFTLAYGVPVDGIWAFINEMSVGLPGLTGRQIELTAANEFDAGVGAGIAALELAAAEGRLTAVARSGVHNYNYRPSSETWVPKSGAGIDTAALRALPASSGHVITLTARLPGSMSIGGVDRQPLLSVAGNPDLPVVPSSSVDTITVTQQYVEADASVLVDGVLCDDCSLVLNGASADITLDPTPASSGVHVVQVLNPDSFSSNEFPVCVDGC